ncbi:MAG: T9SS type A sorting domain-containing protein [Bacteroidota bacterium]
MAYQYNWSNGATTAALIDLPAGVYSLAIIDDQGCQSSTSAMLEQPNDLIIAAVVDSNVSCFGLDNGGVTASVSGGIAPYQYAWSNNETTASISGLTAGSYTLSLTDANGCIKTISRTISQPDSLSAIAKMERDASCFGFENGAVSVLAKGGTAPYEFSWSNGAFTASNGSLSAGTYSVVVSDKFGCQDTASATVGQPSEILSILTVDAEAACGNSNEGALSAAISGGIGPYTYLWSNGATTADLDSLTEGEYTLTITDATGCIQTDTAWIDVLDETAPTVLTQSMSVIPDSNGQVFLQPEDLDAGSFDACGIASMTVSPSQLDCSNMGETPITLTVTDNSGNTASAMATVSIPEISTEVNLDGFLFSATATNAEYQWVDCVRGQAAIPGATEQSFSPQESGIYAVQISQYGCVRTSQCVEVRGVGIADLAFRAQLNLYPNPTSGDFAIDLGEVMREVRVIISTVEGKILSESTYENVGKIQQRISGAEGFYFIRVIGPDQQQTMFKITKR